MILAKGRVSAARDREMGKGEVVWIRKLWLQRFGWGHVCIDHDSLDLNVNSDSDLVAVRRNGRRHWDLTGKRDWKSWGTEVSQCSRNERLVHSHSTYNLTDCGCTCIFSKPPVATAPIAPARNIMIKV